MGVWPQWPGPGGLRPGATRAARPGGFTRDRELFRVARRARAEQSPDTATVGRRGGAGATQRVSSSVRCQPRDLAHTGHGSRESHQTLTRTPQHICNSTTHGRSQCPSVALIFSLPKIHRARRGRCLLGTICQYVSPGDNLLSATLTDLQTGDTCHHVWPHE